MAMASAAKCRSGGKGEYISWHKGKSYLKLQERVIAVACIIITSHYNTVGSSGLWRGGPRGRITAVVVVDGKEPSGASARVGAARGWGNTGCNSSPPKVPGGVREGGKGGKKEKAVAPRNGTRLMRG